MSTVDIAATVVRGAFVLDVDTGFAAGSVTALLGPNGAGKSTVLRSVAGLLPVSTGTIAIAGRVVDDAAGTFAPPARRSVGVVFQDYALFPHLTVLENVAFGLRSRGVAKAPARDRAAEELARVGVADLGGRRPRDVSGGQAQRVALARALATDPDVLLLDEPLAALDVHVRERVRADLAERLADFAGCTILVTHDAIDALLLADRVLVLDAGRAVQDGTPGEISRRPATEFIASLLGVTLLRGIAAHGEVTLDDGSTLHIADTTLGGPVGVVVRPESVALHASRPEGSPRNVWQGVVSGVQPAGDRVRIGIDGRPSVVAAVTPAAVAELRLARGTPLWLSVKAVELDAYPTGPTATDAGVGAR